MWLIFAPRDDPRDKLARWAYYLIPASDLGADFVRVLGNRHGGVDQLSADLFRVSTMTSTIYRRVPQDPEAQPEPQLEPQSEEQPEPGREEQPGPTAEPKPVAGPSKVPVSVLTSYATSLRGVIRVKSKTHSGREGGSFHSLEGGKVGLV